MLFIPALVPTTEAQNVAIPDWTKNIFLWYGEDKMSNDELINALKFLIDEKILSVPASPPSVIKDTTPNNPLYKTYTNEKHDLTFQYPVDWSLAEKYTSQPRAEGVQLAHLWNDGGWAKSSNTTVGPIDMWVTLWFHLSETRAETFFASSGASVKVDYTKWCNSRTLNNDGYTCSDMKIDLTKNSKHGNHLYYVLSSQTNEYEDGEIIKWNRLEVTVTNIDSSWEIEAVTRAEDWEIYKDDIYSIIDSIQTTHVHTNSNDNGLLRLENNVYELPKPGQTNITYNASIDLFGEFSEKIVDNALSFEVKKPDGTTDQENFQFKSKESKKTFTYQYVIKSDYPTGEYEIIITSIPSNIRLPPISFTVVPADPENQVCGGTGGASGTWETLEKYGGDMPAAGFCRTIDPPVLEKQAETKEIPAWSKNIFLWYGQGQVSEDEIVNALQFLINENILSIEK